MKKFITYLLIVNASLSSTLWAMEGQPKTWEKLPPEVKTYIVQFLVDAPTLEQAIANLKKAREINKQMQEIIEDKTNISHIITLLSNNPKFNKSKTYIAAALDLPASLEPLTEEINSLPEESKNVILWSVWQTIKEPGKKPSKLDEIVKNNLLKIFKKSETEIPKQNPLFKAISDNNKEAIQKILELAKNLNKEEKAKLVVKNILEHGQVTNILFKAIDNGNTEIVKLILEFAKRNLTKEEMQQLFTTIVRGVKFAVPTALQRATATNQQDIVNILKEYGAN